MFVFAKKKKKKKVSLINHLSTILVSLFIWHYKVIPVHWRSSVTFVYIVVLSTNVFVETVVLKENFLATW